MHNRNIKILIPTTQENKKISEQEISQGENVYNRNWNQALRKSFIHLIAREYIVGPSKNRKNMQTTPRKSYQRHANANPFTRKPPQKENSNTKGGHEYRERERKEKKRKEFRTTSSFHHLLFFHLLLF